MTSNSEQQPAITSVKDSDIICGRGGLALRHPGNQTYRRIVGLNKQLYATCLKTDKLRISKSIVTAIRETNGRFLERTDGKISVSLNEKDVHGNPVIWRDIGDKRSTEKTSQALREGQPQLLKKLTENEANGVLPQAANLIYDNHTGVTPQPLSQMMPQFDQFIQQSNFNQEQGGALAQEVVLKAEVEPIVLQPPIRNARQYQRLSSFTCSSLEEGQTFSSFPRNSFVENSAPPSGDHSNCVNSTNSVDNLNPSPLSRSNTKRLNESCAEEDLMPFPYHTGGTDNGKDGHLFSTNEQQELMSCLSVYGEGRPQHFQGESAAITADKSPSVKWQMEPQTEPQRTSGFSLSMASHFSELSMCFDDLSLDSAMDALKRESEFDTIKKPEATDTKPRRSILRTVSKCKYPCDPGMLFTSTLDTTPGGVNSGTDVSGLIGDPRKCAVAFEVGVDRRRSSRMSLCSALTDFSETGMADIDDSDDSIEGNPP